MQPSGRARGRSRGTQRPPQDQPQDRRPGPSQAPQSSIGRGAVPRRPGEGAPPGPSSVATGGRVLQRTAVSRPGESISERMEALTLGKGDAKGSGGPSLGRGLMRGKRIISADIIHMKPDHISSKKGTNGVPVCLQTNYFHLNTHTDWRLYQYRVDFNPEEDHTGLRKALLREHKASLGGFIFDGSLLFTSNKLHPDVHKVLEFPSKKNDGTEIMITIKFAGELSVGDDHYVQFFNIMVRRCLQNLNLKLVGRNYFDPNARIEVREFKLELWPGYVTSIRQRERDILMCAEITHKVMRQDTVLDLIADVINSSERDTKRAIQMAVIGQVVLTKYNNRTYRVDDINYEINPSSTFKLKSGEDISFQQYFLKRYNIKLTDMRQPLLISRPTARELRAGSPEIICLIPELCYITGFTESMRNNFSLMKALAEHTRVSPENRIRKLLAFNNRLLSEPSVVQDFKQWNMNLDRRLVEVQGRVMQQEKIIQGHDVKYEAGPQADWTRELRSNAFFLSARLDSWVVIAQGKLMRDAQSFVTSLIRAAAGMKFQILQPFFQDIRDDRQGTYMEALDYCMNSKAPKLVMCVVPNNRADRYSAIKKYCCQHRAVPSQVILAKNLASKGVMSIATKVAIQLNCKLGGIPWTVEMPLNGTMMVGFDVCHDTSDKSKSYGALVASLDKAMSKYYSAVSPHRNGEELSNHLSTNIMKAIRRFKDLNGCLPQRIFVYRDGVGEGQIHYVFEHELEAVKKQLETIYGSKSFKLSFIIVTKRLNSRFFLKGGNPPPGTVIDDVITNPMWYDFFIISQSVRQGTVSPTAYNVISDSSGLDPDKMQRLTYKLTHMYFNWSGTVRVPAPCQYAHKLAFLVGQSIHNEPSPNLENLLYFL